MLKRLFGKKNIKTDAICAASTSKHADPPCITWKHSWTHSEMQDSMMKSPFNHIPIEILLKIFQSFSVTDLCNVSLVCRMFKMVADHDDIWKQKCNSSTKLYSKSFKHIYMDWMYEKYLRNIELRVKLADERSFFRLGCVMIPLPQYPPPQYPMRPVVEHPFESIGGFTQHPNSSPNMTIELSVDIGENARQLMSMLEKASKFQDQWYQPAVLKQLVTRYYRFMQLKATCLPNVLLIPTLDIEIVWQTHLLRPEIYRSDCLRLFRHIVDHSLVTNDIQQFLKEQAFRETCQFYEERFGEKYCELPKDGSKKKGKLNKTLNEASSMNQYGELYLYWDETMLEFSSNSPIQYENPFSFTETEIIVDGRWLDLCKKFMHDSLQQVPVRHYNTRSCDSIDLRTAAMKRLTKSYERFLYMAAKYPLQDSCDFVPPTYAIDIMWHAHMQEPLKYAADCLRLVGYVIVHSPWPTIEDKKTKEEVERKDKIWKQEFQSEILKDHLYNTIEYIDMIDNFETS